MTLITEALVSDGDTQHIALLTTWYKLDQNVVPPAHVLLPLSVVARGDEEAPPVDSHPLGDRQRVRREEEERWTGLLSRGRKLWREAEPKLAAGLRKGVGLCVKQGLMSEEQAHVYYRAGMYIVIAISFNQASVPPNIFGIGDNNYMLNKVVRIL